MHEIFILCQYLPTLSLLIFLSLPFHSTTAPVTPPQILSSLIQLIFTSHFTAQPHAHEFSPANLVMTLFCEIALSSQCCNELLCVVSGWVLDGAYFVREWSMSVSMCTSMLRPMKPLTCAVYYCKCALCCVLL